jgi:hypothetical protein
MGLNLLREGLADWIEGYGEKSRADFLHLLEKHIGHPIDINAWQIEDKSFPRVGSYTSYAIFRFCLHYVVKGDYEKELDKEEEVEREALRAFRRELKPASLRIPYAAHFLESGDTDTIFIPVLFAKPFVYDERFVASLPGGIRALQAFAKGLHFQLTEEAESEIAVERGRWLPLATAKNVARILYTFFTEKPNACVLFS